MLDLFDASLVVAEQEPGSGQEVFVVLLVLDLRVRRVELVRRREEQERAHPLAVMHLGLEQLLSQTRRGISLCVARIEQRLEALELVQDDQIGLERLDARAGQHAAQLGDDLVPLVTGFGWPRSIASERRVEELAQPALQVRVLVERRLEALPYRGIDGAGIVLQARAVFVPFCDVSLQEVHECRARSHQRMEQLKQHLPFPALAGRVSHIERRAGGETDEVQLAVSEPGFAFAMLPLLQM